jgi:hypothetical protein
VFGGEPDETRDDESALICLPCLLCERPELTERFEVARQYGEAIREG